MVIIGDSHARARKFQKGLEQRVRWGSLSVGFRALESPGLSQGGRAGLDDREWLAMRQALSQVITRRPFLVGLWLGGNGLCYVSGENRPGSVGLRGNINEKMSKICDGAHKFVTFTRDLLPEAIVVIFGLAPPQGAASDVVAAFRQLSELLRKVAQELDCLFVDTEAVLLRGLSSEQAATFGFTVPAAWVAGNVVGRPPPVQAAAPRLPERAFSEDGVHFGRCSYAILCREISRILQAQIRWA